MLHMLPNAVLILASFAYAYVAFVRVKPSVHLFSHYFVPCLGKSKWIVGRVSFQAQKIGRAPISDLKA